MKKFFDDAAMQNHPLRSVLDFIEREKANETAKNYDAMRFVGYVLDIGYDTVTIITSDPFKLAVGGVPRGSFLVMLPANYENLPPHFTLLQVVESAPTPLSKEVQQTYFELQKKSMPEIDIFTQSELQWGALSTSILGMLYPDPDRLDKVEFSGDLNNFVSAHKYRVYAPDKDLLNLIINSSVPEENRFELGKLRMTESRLTLPNNNQPTVPVFVSTRDFMGTRTAMFGKTRLGKSNVVKLIAQSLIETTKKTQNVGQLIFDVNGEYANDNPQNLSLKSVFPTECDVYAISPKPATPSKPLKLNFYEQPETGHRVIASLLEQDGRDSIYIRSYMSVELLPIEEVKKIPPGSDQIRAIRKLQMYWAILYKAGFQVNENELRANAPIGNRTSRFNPYFANDLRQDAYGSENLPIPPHPTTLTEMVKEFEVLTRFRRANQAHPGFTTGSGNPLFDANDLALLEFLDPQPGRAGTNMLQGYRIYHDPNATDFMTEILTLIDQGKTIILDLGNANPVVMNYFSDALSAAVFRHQVEKFSNNQLGNHYIQIYFEEAHNLFPQGTDVTNIYSRFAKEGAKYNIGMVYSTQSPTTINKDLLAQTENFFVAHLSSLDEASALARLNVAYTDLVKDILQAKTPGYLRMLTRSHRFVAPVQAHLFQSKVK